MEQAKFTKSVHDDDQVRSAADRISFPPSTKTNPWAGDDMLPFFNYALSSTEALSRMYELLIKLKDFNEIKLTACQKKEVVIDITKRLCAFAEAKHLPLDEICSKYLELDGGKKFFLYSKPRSGHGSVCDCADIRDGNANQQEYAGCPLSCINRLCPDNA